MSLAPPETPDTLRYFVWDPATAHRSPHVPYLPSSVGGRRLVRLDLPGEASGDIAGTAARCDLAVFAIDAGEGLDPALERALSIAHLMGVRHVVLAVRVAGANSVSFARLAADFMRLAEPFGLLTSLALPLLPDDGVAGRSSLIDDPALLDRLERTPVARTDLPFRMAVDDAPERGVVRGMVMSGGVRSGDAVVAAASGRGARVLSIEVSKDRRNAAGVGETAALRLDAAIGAGPGDVLAAAADRPESCDQFAARILWLDDEPLLPGRAYRMRIGTRQAAASITRIKHRIDAGNAAPLAAGTLRAGDEGQVNLSLAEPVVFEPFERDPALGTFTLAEHQSGRTVAAGRIDFALRRAGNIHRQAVDVTKAARAAAKAQRPVLLWFTGLSGSGKSTIANLVEKHLFALGHHTYLLDGDNVRHGLNRDLGFTAQDRVENIRRVAETAKLMVDAGLITLASFISPFRAERRLARDLLAAGEFIEVFVDAPLDVAEARDPKGLYAQARAGRIPNFTGIDSPYEAPDAPELHLRTDRRSAEALADEVIAYLEGEGFLAPPEV